MHLYIYIYIYIYHVLLCLYIYGSHQCLICQWASVLRRALTWDEAWDEWSRIVSASDEKGNHRTAVNLEWRTPDMYTYTLICRAHIRITITGELHSNKLSQENILLQELHTILCNEQSVQCYVKLIICVTLMGSSSRRPLYKPRPTSILWRNLDQLQQLYVSDSPQ